MSPDSKWKAKFIKLVNKIIAISHPNDWAAIEKFAVESMNELGPSIYVTTRSTPLLDAFTCKTDDAKIIIAQLELNQKVELYDCPEQKGLVGVKARVPTRSVIGLYDGKLKYMECVGYVDYTHLKEYNPIANV